MAATLYVSVNSTNPIPPYADWSTAATNIQDAVDASTNSDTVLVTNGVYATGGKKWFDSGTNRVTLTNAITLQSVNGPGVTWIVGTQVAGTGAALTNTARCVAIGSSAVLSGFTLTNGEAGQGNYPNGGGVSQVQSISAAGTVTNCVLIGNLSTNGFGGGAYRVKLINCQIIGNYATSGGGACACTLLNCTIISNSASSASGTGGGVYGSTTFGASVLNGCTLVGNSANQGGGAFSSALTNCVLRGNAASSRGGGLYQGSANNSLFVSNTVNGSGGGADGGSSGAMLVNCTVVGNTATSSGGGVYGGSGAWMDNCIVYFNSAPTGSNSIGAKFDSTCTTPPLTGGTGITNDPAFVNPAAGDFHLSSNSPCINSGNNAYVTNGTDLDGNPRIVGGTVDIGAYEYQSPASRISYAWLQNYGIPINTNTDTSDADGDRMSNYSEWLAGTNPTNPASLLQMQFPTNNLSGLTISWQSVNTRTYYLQRATNLRTAPAFSLLKSNIVGQVGTTSYTDTTATNRLPYFYRVGVQ
jgi:hypothetical protein